MLENLMGAAPESLYPTAEICGYKIRPGFFLIKGAMAIPGGVNFTISSLQAEYCELLLFHRTEKEPYAIIRFPDSFRIGNTFSMIVFGLKITEFEYAYRMGGPYLPQRGIIFDADKCLLDPYAKAVTGQSVWGANVSQSSEYHARVVEDNFDWGDFIQPSHKFSDLVIYEMHTRGFTKHDSSGVKDKGTFAGILEKLPYLIELGVNAVELMPVFEFNENEDMRNYNGRRLYNYWGYNSVCFFAPNTSYTAKLEYNREGNELKELIRELNHHGIEVILDVVFNHTAEGNENGPFFSFKGIDNNIYYMLTPDGRYYNFSGCGNALNCNHPIVRQFILDCLRYWVVEYRVDGFRFDLASIMGRNKDGSPMSNPPLLEVLAVDPILGNVKLIAEAWDAGGLYQVGSFSSCTRWAEWNGRYRDDIRCFLKGDAGMAGAAIERITGSRDLYNPEQRGDNVSVNFITCHDGFTLYDLYAYNMKHNEENGWNNTDGTDCNNSWNCGAEGETDDSGVLSLRKKLRRNAFAVLMCSRGAAMFLSGDEFCNTQFGNNNPYCQDNEISWLDWTRKEKYGDMYDFCRKMIAFRKKHPVLRSSLAPSNTGFPDISIHNSIAWNCACDKDTRVIGIMFAGASRKQAEDIVFIGINAFWEAKPIELPRLPVNMEWRLYADTAAENPFPDTHASGNFTVQPRSVVVFYANNIK